MPHLSLLLLMAWAGAGIASAQQIMQVRWPTGHAAQPVMLNGAAKEWLPAFRIALTSLPEASIITLCLSQPQMLGLPAEDGRVLQRLVSERYSLMAKDALFQAAPTSLAYCFSEAKPIEGLATVHVPASCTRTTPCIVFLHGYGGSFVWYLHVLVEAFPDHLIVCPAHGMSCGEVSREYVRESLAAVERRLGFALARPTLLGLSAGGFGACLLYAQRPDEWRQMICLAAYGRDPALSRFTRGMELRFMAGAEEFFVRDGSFQRGVQTARSKGAAVDAFLVPECGHFFLLQKRTETIATLQRWLTE